MLEISSLNFYDIKLCAEYGYCNLKAYISAYISPLINISMNMRQNRANNCNTYQKVMLRSIGSYELLSSYWMHICAFSIK